MWANWSFFKDDRLTFLCVSGIKLKKKYNISCISIIYIKFITRKSLSGYRWKEKGLKGMNRLSNFYEEHIYHLMLLPIKMNIVYVTFSQYNSNMFTIIHHKKQSSFQKPSSYSNPSIEFFVFNFNLYK